MDTVYVLSALIVMAVSCFIQYRITMASRKFLFFLPLIYAILTFWLGFIALLFAFALIFIGELAPGNHQRNKTDVF